MAVYHFKSTGTRTTGESTPDDWSDANSYVTSAIVGMFNSSTPTPGDEFILDDESHTIDRLVAAGQTNMANGQVTVRGRSNDSSLCTIIFTRLATNSINLNPPAGTDVDYLLRGFRFGLSAPHTAPAHSVVNESTRCAEVIFDDIDFSGLEINKPELTSTIDRSPLVGGSTYGGARSRINRYRDCKWGNIAGVYGAAGNGESCFLHYEQPEGTTIFEGTNQISDCSYRNLNTTSGTQAAGRGYFHLLGDVQFNGNILVDTCTSDVAFNDAFNRPVFFINGGTSKSVSQAAGTSIEADGLVWTSGRSSAALMMIDDTPYTLRKIQSKNSTSTPTPFATDRGLGCNLLITRDGAQGTIEAAIAENCGSYFGPSIYYSQGGGGTCGTNIAIDCDVHSGASYWGGWGDITIENQIIVGTGVFDAEMGLLDAVCLYSHIHTGSPRSITRRLGSYFYADNVDDGVVPEMIHRNRGISGFDYTITLERGIHGNLANQIHLENEGPDELHVTINDTAYQTSRLENDTATTLTVNNQLDQTVDLGLSGGASQSRLIGSFLG